MGDLFKDILKEEESLFLNPQFLDYDYQPKLVPCREPQQQQIASCIKPLLQRRNGKNLTVLGTPGVGKTVSLKHILYELKEDYSNELFCIYLNCWKKDTSFKVITDICHQLNYKWTHNKNFEELAKAAAELINEKSAVIILDEVDKLQDDNIIYTLLEDIFKKTLILITNEQDFIIKLDNRIRSRLQPELLEFKPYTKEQVREILQQRVKYVFVPEVLEQEALNIIIDKTFESKDMRVGIFLLKQSGENAEEKSSKKITIKYAQDAINSLTELDINNNLNSEETLLPLIKENSGKPQSEIFKIYEEKERKSYRTFQRKLNELKKTNKIKTKEEQGDLGKHTILEYLD
ncbi:AAA family ATPase [Candidatus Woesearchaeota archaeon]|nr:AAA family ATPase [Candidatus Woesearchaeota archaeon]